MKQYKETAAYLSALKEFKALAKKADRRLREIERFSRYDEFSNIKNYAYRTAKRDIDAWTPPDQHYDKPRFSRNIPMDTRTLRAKIKDIQKFLDKPTSTVTGIKKIYKKRADAINKKYGTDFTWQQLAKFFEDGGMADKSFNKYGSKTVLIAVGKMQASDNKIIEDIKKGSSINIDTPDDNKVINDTINSLLSNYGKELSDILS